MFSILIVGAFLAASLRRSCLLSAQHLELAPRFVPRDRLGLTAHVRGSGHGHGVVVFVIRVFVIRTPASHGVLTIFAGADQDQHPHDVMTPVSYASDAERYGCLRPGTIHRRT